MNILYTITKAIFTFENDIIKITEEKKFIYEYISMRKLINGLY